jgi:hypothetical protein
MLNCTGKLTKIDFIKNKPIKKSCAKRISKLCGQILKKVVPESAANHKYRKPNRPTRVNYFACFGAILPPIKRPLD